MALVVAVVQTDCNLLQFLEALRVVHIAEFLLVRKSLHRCQLALGLGGHLLALGARLTTAASSAFCALEQDSGVNVSHLVWTTCETGLRLRVGRI